MANKNRKNTVFILAAAFGVLAFFLFILGQPDGDFHQPEVKAAMTDNVYGFAWSENIGWISFNSVNCDIDGDGTYKGAAETGGPAPAGCPISGTVKNYGVNVNFASADKELSGFAWSENIGWISFDKNVTGNPPGAPYNGAETYIAKYNSGANQFSGWARALSACQDDLWDNVNKKCLGSGAGNKAGGWDGWIKLRKNPFAAPAYEVTSSGNNFMGWAWGSDVVGWISFNSRNCDTNGNNLIDPGEDINGCPAVATNIPSYKVYFNGNLPPTANDLSVTPPTNAQLCGNTPAYTLSWTFSDPDAGDVQDGLLIQVDKDSDFLSPTIDKSFLTGYAGSSYLAELTMSPDAPLAGKISYGETYYWRVKVIDDKGNSSNWIYPPNPVGAPTIAPGNSFGTIAHAYPSAKFFCSPSTTNCPIKHYVGENINFADKSQVYGGASVLNWVWDFGDGTSQTIVPNPPAVANGDISYSYPAPGFYPLTFTVTDSSNFSCTGSQTMNIGYGTPTWSEVNPTP